MEDPKVSKVFQEVLAKTKAGKIKWEPSASVTDYFAVLPGDFTITISWIDLSPLDPGRFEFTLKQDDQEIFQIFSEFADGGKLQELYDLARGEVLRVDAKVDELLGELAKM
jgi:hypothetical protein